MYQVTTLQPELINEDDVFVFRQAPADWLDLFTEYLTAKREIFSTNLADLAADCCPNFMTPTSLFVRPSMEQASAGDGYAVEFPRRRRRFAEATGRAGLICKDGKHRTGASKGGRHRRCKERYGPVGCSAETYTKVELSFIDCSLI